MNQNDRTHLLCAPKTLLAFAAASVLLAASKVPATDNGAQQTIGRFNAERSSQVRKIKQLVVGIVVAAVLAVLFAAQSVALAHNAGHIILPSGECLNVGSGKEAPYVGPDKEQLDLIPGPGDQYGARYAADQGNTPILPGDCPP